MEYEEYVTACREKAATMAYNLSGEEWDIMEKALHEYIHYLEDTEALFSGDGLPYVREADPDDVYMLLHKIEDIGNL